MNSPLNLLRLAGLPLSLTLLSILAGSVINRVMVVELGLPVILAGLFVAIPLLVSPARIWLGHVSDAYPLWGRRREPYLILGALIAGAGAALAVALVVRTPALFSLGAGLILLALIAYGLVLGLDVAATTQLTMFWGLGALSSLLLSGLALIRWLGLARLYWLGIILLIPLFPLIILAGLNQQAWLLQASVLGMGLASGLAAASLLAQTVAFTSLRSAGLLLGVWGLGHQLGRALASLLGSGLVDGLNLTIDLLGTAPPSAGERALFAYGMAFMVEAGLLAAALRACGRLRIESSRAREEA